MLASCSSWGQVCWPQFGTFGDLPKHGFARNSGDWKLTAKSIDAETGNPEVALRSAARFRESRPPPRLNSDAAEFFLS